MLAVQAVTLDVEDLEADATPEDLMLSYVSGEKGKVLLPRLLDSSLACAFCTEVAVHRKCLCNSLEKLLSLFTLLTDCSCCVGSG